MGNFEDDDHKTFLQAGDLPTLSRAAFTLHTAAIVNAYKSGHPRMVPDDYLSAMPAETTATAMELCLAGLWERVESGYIINDDDAVAMVGDMHLGMAERQDRCSALGGHVPSEEDPSVCGRCFTPLRQDSSED